MPKLVAVPSVVYEPLELPLIGRDGTEKTYTIPEISAGDMLTLQAMRFGYDTPEDAALRATVRSEYHVYAKALSGPVLDAMIADGVSSKDMARAARTASTFAATFGDLEKTEAVWSGKAQEIQPDTTGSRNDSATHSPEDPAKSGAEADALTPGNTDSLTTPSDTSTG